MMIHSTPREASAIPVPCPALPVFTVGARVSYLGEPATIVHGNTCDPAWCAGYGHATVSIRFERNVTRRMSRQMDVYATSLIRL